VAGEILDRAGYQYQVVGSGRQAVEAVADENFDLVLMDCQMPDMDGLEATRTIRERERRAADQAAPVRRLPIVALTANAVRGDRERCLEAGMDSYLSKPIDPVKLLEEVSRLLELVDAPSAASPRLPCSEEAEASDAPPLDLAALERRCMGDAAFARRILKKFAARLEDDITRIEGCLTREDSDEGRAEAHALKGAAGNVSAIGLQRAAASLEAALAAGDLEAANVALPRVRAQAREFQLALTRLPAMEPVESV
jgi:two-component system sensor histidine kinase/response regulator